MRIQICLPEINIQKLLLFGMFSRRCFCRFFFGTMIRIEFITVQVTHHGGNCYHTNGIAGYNLHGIRHIDQTVDACNPGNDGKGQTHGLHHDGAHHDTASGNSGNAGCHDDT